MLKLDMEYLMKKIIILVLFSIAISPLKADSIETDNNEIINRALQYYLIEDQDQLIKDHNLLSQEFKKNKQSKVFQLSMLFHEFLIADISSKKMKKKYSKLCIANSNVALSKSDAEADLYAVLSACYGLSAESNLFKAASHGTQSGRMIDKALAIDSNNAFVYMIKGIGDYTRPSFAGGSKENGNKNLSIALELTEKHDNSVGDKKFIIAIANFHLANIAFITKNKQQALQYLKNSLRVAPDYKRALELSKNIES